jgi:hypothetical protein
MNGVKHTLETRALDVYPNIRTAVVNSPAFVAWLGTLPQVEVDGETLYLRGGDMLRDRDQIIFEWARRNGLLTEEAITHLSRKSDE